MADITCLRGVRTVDGVAPQTSRGLDGRCLHGNVGLRLYFFVDVTQSPSETQQGFRSAPPSLDATRLSGLAPPGPAELAAIDCMRELRSSGARQAEVAGALNVEAA